MRKLDSNAHSVFLLYYHLILVIKYRKKILTNPVSERAREIFEYIAPKYHVTLEEWNHDRDHVHIMFISCSGPIRNRNSANLSMRIKAQAAD